MARALLPKETMESAIRSGSVRESSRGSAAASPIAAGGITAREALNGAALAAMIASYLVIVFLFSS
jgi:hypothetical protein